MSSASIIDVGESPRPAPGTATERRGYFAGRGFSEEMKKKHEPCMFNKNIVCLLTLLIVCPCVRQKKKNAFTTPIPKPLRKLSPRAHRIQMHQRKLSQRPVRLK